MHYNVSKKFTPVVSEFLEFLIKILNAYYMFTFTLNYKILFSFLQVRQSYAVISTTTQ